MAWFKRKKKEEKGLVKVDNKEAQKEAAIAVNPGAPNWENLEAVTIQQKTKNAIWFPFWVVVYTKKGAWEYDRDFGVELWKDKETNNKYLIRTTTEQGVKKVLFFEPFPEDEFSPRDFIKQIPEFKRRIAKIDQALAEIKKQENKTNKKMSLSKKDLIKERLELQRYVSTSSNDVGGQYVVREKGGIHTIEYREQDGILMPQKKYFQNNAIKVPGENKRASRSRQSEVNKKVFSQDNKIHWGLIITWLIAIAILGLDVWWAINLQEDAGMMPKNQISELRVAVEENNIKSQMDARKYCEEYYQTFIDDLKRLRNPDLYTQDPVEVEG